MAGHVRTRFAPSPNGALHLGHALSAMVSHDFARRHGGRFLVRIEDIDAIRSREALIAAILDDLEWLGLASDEPVLRQSSRLESYRAAARRLESDGLLYKCTASRSEIEAAADPACRDPDGALLYPGRGRCVEAAEEARRLASGAPFALRVDMARAMARAQEIAGAEAFHFVAVDFDGCVSRQACDPAAWGDAVIVRKDIPTSYHLAVVVDDTAQAISHVTRGCDLEAATAIHRLLQVLLGLPAPVYHHHRLITDEAGRKLSKSASDTSLRQLREAGATPDDVRRLIAWGRG